METFKKHLLKIGGKDVLMPESLPIAIQQKGHLYEYKVLVPVGGASRYYISNEDDIHLVWDLYWMKMVFGKYIHGWFIMTDRLLLTMRSIFIIMDLKEKFDNNMEDGMTLEEFKENGSRRLGTGWEIIDKEFDRLYPDRTQNIMEQI